MEKKNGVIEEDSGGDDLSFKDLEVLEDEEVDVLLRRLVRTKEVLMVGKR